MEEVTDEISERNSLAFSMRGPIPIQLDELASGAISGVTSSTSGASVLDLLFPQAETVAEIRFRNRYTAQMTVLVRFDDSVQAAPKREHLAWAAAASLSLARLRGVESTEGIKIGRNLTGSKSLSDWVVSIQNRELMVDPHTEQGSQDNFTITSSDSLVPLHDITAIRFLLRQPSPNWKTFGLDDVTLFRHPFLTSVSQSRNWHKEDKSETILDCLIRQTRDALVGRSAGSSDTGEEGISQDDLCTPSCYDIVSLQIN